MTTTAQHTPPPKPPLDLRIWFWQLLVVALVFLIIWFLASNTLNNMEARGIASGFDFLGRNAGLPIGETLIHYTPTHTFATALLVGLLNTLRVAIIGIAASTILGTLVGVARLSPNWLLAKGASVYVEVMRNTPLLLQLFFWYAVFQGLPGPRQAVSLWGIGFLSNRGLIFAAPIWHSALLVPLIVFFLSIICLIFFVFYNSRRQRRTGQRLPLFAPAVGILLVPTALVWILNDHDLQWDVPVLAGFNFSGGSLLTPEFKALTIGLVMYTSAFIGEIVRSGIMSVPRGQWEAASALGLRRGRSLSLVVLPQALRVSIPPLTSQYLNITKNSSLAVAIGYPDLVSVANTTLNQTGQAIEGIAIIMACYLAISLSISLFMNWYNKKVALVGR